MFTPSLARFLSLSAIWGSSFIFMRMLAPQIGAVLTADLRLLLAGAVLSAYLVFRKLGLQWKEHWRHYLLIGAVNSGIPFMLFSYAALSLPASYLALVNSTSPLFGAIFSALFLRDPLSARKAIGIALGAMGVAFVVNVGPQELTQEFLIGIFACLAGASCYGLAGVYLRKFAKHVETQRAAAGSLVMAGVMLLPLTYFFPVQIDINASLIFNILFLALVCTAIGYVLYFRLIQDWGAPKALTVTFLVPVFGMLWGALFLGEHITLAMGFGAFLILCGTSLVLKTR